MAKMCTRKLVEDNEIKLKASCDSVKY